MRPTLTRPNASDERATYTEEWTYPFSGDTGFRHRTYCPNVVWSEFVVPHVDAMCHPLTLDGVTRVVGVCAEVEMVGTNTTLVVAAVKDEQAVWDRSVRQFERDAMCPCLPPAPSQGTVTTTTVRAVQMSAFPFPACLALDDAGPEAFHPSIIQVFQ